MAEEMGGCANVFVQAHENPTGSQQRMLLRHGQTLQAAAFSCVTGMGIHSEYMVEQTEANGTEVVWLQPFCH